MSLTLGQAPKSSGTPAPAGTHLAIAYAVIDCGTHTTTGTFGTKTERKIKLSWELPEEKHVFKDERGPEPFSCHKQYNFSTNEKSNLRKDLESWRSRPFTPEELETFDLKTLIGVPCLLNVVYSQKGDKTYANIASISPVPKAMKGSVPPLHNPSVFYTITQGKDATFNKLPQFMQDYISQCAEWNSKSGSASNGLAPDGSVEDEFSDVPF